MEAAKLPGERRPIPLEPAELANDLPTSAADIDAFNARMFDYYNNRLAAAPLLLDRHSLYSRRSSRIRHLMLLLDYSVWLWWYQIGGCIVPSSANVSSFWSCQAARYSILNVPLLQGPWLIKAREAC